MHHYRQETGCWEMTSELLISVRSRVWMEFENSWCWCFVLWTWERFSLKCCVALLPQRYIHCYTKDGVAPPLPGLNLMLF